MIRSQPSSPLLTNLRNGRTALASKAGAKKITIRPATVSNSCRVPMWPVIKTPRKKIAAAVKPAKASRIPTTTIAKMIASAGAIACAPTLISAARPNKTASGYRNPAKEPKIARK